MIFGVSFFLLDCCVSCCPTRCFCYRHTMTLFGWRQERHWCCIIHPVSRVLRSILMRHSFCWHIFLSLQEDVVQNSDDDVLRGKHGEDKDSIPLLILQREEEESETFSNTCCLFHSLSSHAKMTTMQRRISSERIWWDDNSKSWSKDRFEDNKREWKEKWDQQWKKQLQDCKWCLLWMNTKDFFFPSHPSSMTWWWKERWGPNVCPKHSRHTKTSTETEKQGRDINRKKITRKEWGKRDMNPLSSSSLDLEIITRLVITFSVFLPLSSSGYFSENSKKTSQWLRDSIFSSKEEKRSPSK